MIYVIREQGTQNYKIGYTANEPAERLKQLQTGNGVPLELVAAHEGGTEQEARWHQLLDIWRIDGAGKEWFRLPASAALAVVMGDEELMYSDPYDATSATKVGKFFHSVDENGDVKWQGRVSLHIAAGMYKCMTYSWLDGFPYEEVVVHEQEMENWRFYHSQRAWLREGDRVEWERAGCPGPDLWDWPDYNNVDLDRWNRDDMMLSPDQQVKVM